MENKMTTANIFCGIGVLFVMGLILCGCISTITMLNNETKEIIVDCYDEQHNLINELTCIKELYYCNKFERFFNPESCVGKIIE